MLRIEQSYQIKAAPERVWAALTDPVLQRKWSGQTSKYDARVGGAYKLFGDYVRGKIVECEPPTRLAQTWKPSDWTIDDSVVSFTLKKVRGGTRLDLVHENVQPEDYEGTREGWNQFYVGAIKRMLEGEAQQKLARGETRGNALRKAKPARGAGKAVTKKGGTAKRADAASKKKS